MSKRYTMSWHMTTNAIYDNQGERTLDCDAACAELNRLTAERDVLARYVQAERDYHRYNPLMLPGTWRAKYANGDERALPLIYMDIRQAARELAAGLDAEGTPES